MGDKINGQSKNTIDNSKITNAKSNNIYDLIEDASCDFINELKLKKQDNIAMFSPHSEAPNNEPKISKKNETDECIDKFIKLILVLVVYICVASLLFEKIVFLGSIVLIFIQGAFETYFGLNIENFLKILNPLMASIKVGFDYNKIKKMQKKIY